MPSIDEIANAAIYDHHAIQKEDELKALLNFCIKHEVKRVLEIGCDSGGMLYAFRRLGCEVFGVDLPNAGFSSGLSRYNHGANVIDGNSHDPVTYSLIENLLELQPVELLFIDGDHTYDGISNDFWLYRHLVNPDGFIAIHDICELTKYTNDLKVYLFWENLKKQYPHWEYTEFKQYPYSWAGIGIVKNDLHTARTVTGPKCGHSKWVEYPTDANKDFTIFCDFPAGHNVGVSSRHHYQGLYWW